MSRSTCRLNEWERRLFARNIDSPDHIRALLGNLRELDGGDRFPF